MSITNRSSKGCGQGHVTNLKFYTSLNISGMAEARVAKFCVVVGCIKF